MQKNRNTNKMRKSFLKPNSRARNGQRASKNRVENYQENPPGKTEY